MDLSHFNVEDHLEDFPPKKSAESAKPAEPEVAPSAGVETPTRKDLTMKATAADVKRQPKKYGGFTSLGHFQSYDYKKGKIGVSTSALTPDISHFEKAHNLAATVEHFGNLHQHLIDSTDMHPADRAAAQDRLNRFYDTMADFHEENGRAMQAHLDGKHTSFTGESRTQHSLANAANIMTRAVGHLHSAMAITETERPGTTASIPEHMESLVNGYTKHLKDAGIAVAATPTATEPSEATPVQRLPLLSEGERAAQQSKMAQTRAASAAKAGTPIVGEEQQMMGKPTIRAFPGRAPEGYVTTPSGSFAPEADVAAFGARQQARQKASEAKEQATASEIRAARRPAPAPRFNFTKASGVDLATPESGSAQPVDRFAAERLDRISRPPVGPTPERAAAFRQQQESAKAATQQARETQAAVEAGRDARVQASIAKDEDVVRGHIDAENYRQAAIHHFNNLTSMGNKAKLNKKEQGLRNEVVENPVSYLSKQGYDLGIETAPQGMTPKRAVIQEGRSAKLYTAFGRK
jgi:hypothetical protein